MGKEICGDLNFRDYQRRAKRGPKWDSLNEGEKKSTGPLQPQLSLGRKECKRRKALNQGINSKN